MNLAVIYLQEEEVHTTLLVLLHYSTLHYTLTHYRQAQLMQKMEAGQKSNTQNHCSYLNSSISYGHQGSIRFLRNVGINLL